MIKSNISPYPALRYPYIAKSNITGGVILVTDPNRFVVLVRHGDMLPGVICSGDKIQDCCWDKYDSPLTIQNE